MRGAAVADCMLRTIARDEAGVTGAAHRPVRVPAPVVRLRPTPRERSRGRKPAHRRPASSIAAQRVRREPSSRYTDMSCCMRSRSKDAVGPEATIRPTSMTA